MRKMRSVPFRGVIPADPGSAGAGSAAEMGRRSFGSPRPVQRTGASEAPIREVRPEHQRTQVRVNPGLP